MGRPREHNERTASALLEPAARPSVVPGIGALSRRELASDAGTTTRAVYSLFGSKEGLLGALGSRAFELLEEGLEALPMTDDPCADLTDAALMFRRFALEHPALFSIGIQRTDPEAWPHFRSAASSALAVLHERIEPIAAADLIGERSVGEAALQFHSLCEGLAAVELRGTPLTPTPERFWRDAFGALIAGFGQPAPHGRPRR